MNVMVILALLGVIQGLTEFLPVSSSGHLVIAETLFHKWLGVEFPEGVMLEVMLHLGTVVAVCVCYRKKIRDLLLDPVIYSDREAAPKVEAVEWWKWIILATLATGIVVVPAKKYIEDTFENVHFVGGALIVTGLLVASTHWLARPSKAAKPDVLRMAMAASRYAESPQSKAKAPPIDWRLGMSWKTAVMIGLAQGLAALPGISRSGTTIATALLLGVAPSMAVSFSFLISIPAVLGAVTLKLLKTFMSHSGELGTMGWSPLLLGVVTACIVGMLAIQTMVKVVENRNMAWFALYLIPVGLMVMFWI